MSPMLPPCCLEGPTRGSGGLAIGGSAVPSQTLAVASEGGLALGGSALPVSSVQAVAAGGLVVGGQAVPHTIMGALGLGGLALGGAAAPRSSIQAVAAGGLALGGAAAPRSSIQAVAAGGLALGGAAGARQIVPSGSGSGSGGGEAGCALCVGGVAARQFTFVLSGIGDGTCTDCGNLDGTHTLTYEPTCEWVERGPLPVCGIPSVILLGLVPGVVTLGLQAMGVTYQYHGSWDCLSPLSLVQTATNADCQFLPSTITISPV